MALSRHHAAISRPLNVEEIVRQAQDFEFGSYRSLKNWLRSAQMLLTESAICEQDRNLQMAYLYLYRHAELVLGKFPQHPEYKDPRYKVDLQQAQKIVQKNLTKLEQWKPKISQDYQRYVKTMERRKAERQRIEEELRRDEGPSVTIEEIRRDSIGSEDGAFDQSLNANDNRQLAVDLAHKEIRRRDANRRSTRQAGISPGTVASRRRGVVVDSLDGDEGRPHHHHLGLDHVSDGVREAGRHLHHHDRPPQRQSSTDRRNLDSNSYRYPSVPTKEDAIDWRMPALQPAPRPAGPPPSLPAKEALENRFSYLDEQAPPVPPSPQTATPSPPPGQGQQPTPSKYTFKPTAFSEAGAPLRTMMLPPHLRETFLNLADANTARNLETCGILCGTLISNALFINHLVIPDQTSTSDTCDTTETGDNALFDFCDSNDLLVCGWIHTHPSQSCFLSSRDLHTSSGYQIMLPEAIAIVCAPRHNPDWGIFRLTDPPGLNHVLNCQQKGLFHPHSETNLYTDALRPGHVVEGPGLQFEVVDLRS